jgi:hypothetical protein
VVENSFVLEFRSIIQFIVETYNVPDLNLVEYRNILFGSHCCVGLVVTDGEGRSKCHYAAWDNPIEPTIPNLIVVFVFRQVKCVKLEPFQLVS